MSHRFSESNWSQMIFKYFFCVEIGHKIFYFFLQGHSSVNTLLRYYLIQSDPYSVHSLEHDYTKENFHLNELSFLTL